MNRDAVMSALGDAGLAPVADAPFGLMTTYGTGGTAAVSVAAGTEDELVAVGTAVRAAGGADVFVLGNGSNTLVSDAGFDGVVVRLAAGEDRRGEIEVDGTFVTCPGRMPLPVLARRSVAAGLCGLEWAVGVPGTVGGAVRMNAGGHGSDFEESLVTARVVSLLTGARADVDVADLGLHFRGSALRDHHVVVSARLRAESAGDHDCAGELASIVAWRRENQPGGRNAGSVFVNPAPGAGSSGALIDSCGLRGTSRGSATVSERHANFIQAADGATSADIVELMSFVQDEVQKHTGILLRSETRLVGFPPDTVARFSVPYAHVESPSGDRLAGILGEA